MELEKLNKILSDRETQIELNRYAVFLARDRDLAMDILQDTFIKAIDKHDQCDGKNVIGWLKVICRNRLRDVKKKKSPQSFTSLIKNDDDDNEPDNIENNTPEDDMGYRILIEIVKSLKPPKPEIVEKTALGYTRAQIADELGMGVTTVTDHLAAAKKQIEEIYYE
tara:strand:- start:256 stop:753 length:498 start_codon:yes stop_codon:yes gene_type:complete